MADNEIKELLIDLKDAQKETFKRIDELGQKQEETTKRLDEFGQKQEETAKRIDELGQKQEETTKRLDEFGEKQEETFKRLDELGEKQQKMEKNLLEKINQVSLAVARIEVEHGEKLDILLDVVTGHTEKFNSVNKRVEKCEKRLDNHDDKIYALNSAVRAY